MVKLESYLIMRKNDWIGLGASVLLHLLVILGLGLVAVAAAEPEQLGYIEVDFGPLTEGRPVRVAEETQPEVPEVENEKPPQPEPQAAPPEEAKPVDLPDQPAEVVEEEVVEAPQTETIAPQQQNSEAEVRKPEPKPEQNTVKPLGGGNTGGTTGAAQGDAGSGNDEQKAAPFDIEGLNRTPVYTPLPQYAEKVNAVIKVRVFVDPRGNVASVIPVQKGSPSLDQAVIQAVRRWRFNPLPAGAPQQNQPGTITFRFRLE